MFAFPENGYAMFLFLFDEFIFLADGMIQLLEVRKWVLNGLYRLGLCVSLKKFVLQVGDLIKHLGMDLDFASSSI